MVRPDAADRSDEHREGENGFYPSGTAAEGAPAVRVGFLPARVSTLQAPLWMDTAARVVLGAVWAWVAAAMLTDAAASVRTLRVGRVLPEWLADTLGYGLPVLEIGLAVLLLLGLATRLTEVIGSVLLVLFLADLIAAAVATMQAGCGCFGGAPAAGQAVAYAGAILRDAGLLAICAFSVWTDRTTRRAQRTTATSTQGPEDLVERGTAAHLYRMLGEHADWSRRTDERRLQRMSVLAGVALIAVIGTGIELRTALSDPVPATPPNASIAGGITVGRADAPVRLDLWEDLQAAACSELQTQIGPQIVGWIDDGVAQVHFHVIALLDVQSSTDYSSRAANALYSAANRDPTTFVTFRQLLYAHRPSQGSRGPSDDDLIRLADQAGIPSLGDAVRAGLYSAYVTRATDQAFEDGVTSTPTVKVNGAPVAHPTAENIEAAVIQAAN